MPEIGDARPKYFIEASRPSRTPTVHSALSGEWTACNGELQPGTDGLHDHRCASPGKYEGGVSHVLYIFYVFINDFVLLFEVRPWSIVAEVFE